MANREGGWRKREFVNGKDSLFRTIQKSTRRPYEKGMYQISLGRVEKALAEPDFGQHLVNVALVRGDDILEAVAWPGAQINVNASGDLGGTAVGLHGLFEAPLPGQQVVVGYLDGNGFAPVVLQKYPYNAHQRIDLEAMHTLPLTQLSHGPKDVLLGSFTGSFMALRGTDPMPGQIDIESVTDLTMSAFATIDILSLGAMKITSDTTMDLAATGIMKLDASPAVVVNSGTFPVAKLGDKTLTLLGPSPIIATGTDLLVP